ncbi:MAG TPA: polysaccharide deacetylase family protein [Brumimicrobium sp.]|nr:polysaccharide deacetylase family protein [Brumimicrobium sp.]
MSKHQVGYVLFCLFTVVFFFGYFTYNWGFTFFFIGFLVWFAALVYGSFSIRANFHLKAIHRGEVKGKIVAITFDDGPTEFTLKALELLNKYRQKASFFCIGKQVQKHEKIVVSIVENGHEVGNHTFSHAQQMGFKNTAEMIEEIECTDKILEGIVEKKTRYFRPPFGVTNPAVRRAIQETKHIVVGWNIRSLDTSINNEKRIFNRIKRKIKPGSIILLHDTSKKSINVLEQLLIYLEQEEYKSVTVTELLNFET